MGHDCIVWDDSDLTIPEMKYGRALDELRKITDNLFELRERETIAQTIIDLLNANGYEAEEENSHIRITYDPGNDMDIPDQTLGALMGVATAGSYITYFDISGGYWQLRYTDTLYYTEPGRIVFDEHPLYPFKTECRRDKDK